MSFGIKPPDMVGSYIKGREASTNDAYKRAIMGSTLEKQKLDKDKFEEANKQKKFQLLYKHTIQPAFNNLKKQANSTQEEFDSLSEQFKTDYPWVEDFVGKNWRVFKRPDKGINLEVDYKMTKEDIETLPLEVRKYVKVGKQVRLKRDADTGQIDIEDIGRQIKEEQSKIDKRQNGSNKKQDFSSSNMISLWKGISELYPPDEAIEETFKIAQQLNPDTAWTKAELRAGITNSATPNANVGTLPSFKTTEEALAADLPSGTIVTVNGRKARID